MPVVALPASFVPPGSVRIRPPEEGSVMRRFAFLVLSASLLSAVPYGGALAQHGAESSNMALVGHHDLQGRSAYQPLVHLHRVPDQGGRWIAYVGHHGANLPNALTGRNEDSGTSILD